MQIRKNEGRLRYRWARTGKWGRSIGVMVHGSGGISLGIDLWFWGGFISWGHRHSCGCEYCIPF